MACFYSVFIANELTFVIMIIITHVTNHDIRERTATRVYLITFSSWMERKCMHIDRE